MGAVADKDTVQEILVRHSTERNTEAEFQVLKWEQHLLEAALWVVIVAASNLFVAAG